MAYGQFSSKMSNPVNVRVVVPLTEVTLSVSGEQLVNRTLEVCLSFKGRFGFLIDPLLGA